MIRINRQTDYAVQETLALAKRGPVAEDCLFQSNYPVRTKWGRVQAAMLRELTKITFEDLLQKSLGLPLVAVTMV